MIKAFLFFILFSWLALANAATFHSILVGDTSANRIGEDVQTDLIKIKEEIQSICFYTGLEGNEIILEGREVIIEKLSEVIDNLQINEDDRVFFYFSGHGYRNYCQKNLWPMLYFTWNKNGVEFLQIIEKLQAKNPALLVAIIDCCNVYVLNSSISAIDIPKIKAINHPQYLKKNYCTLFLESSGSIIATSSKAGQYSYCGKNGSFFTSALLITMKNDLFQIGSSASWERILLRTSEQIKHYQTPYFEIRKK